MKPAKNELITVWITKYALTAGITGEKAKSVYPHEGMIEVPGEWFKYFHGEGKEWHRTREGAVKRAEEMRARKIASLKKQLIKIEALTFEE